MANLSDIEKLLPALSRGEKAQILKWVVRELDDDGRILFTHNRRHFLRLHRHRTADHAGIVVCTFDPISVDTHNALTPPLRVKAK